jgi:hypothetical protein
MFILSFFLSTDPDIRPNYDGDISLTFRNGLIYILLYFLGFFAFYIFSKRLADRQHLSTKLFCFIFLFISPTIKSSSVIITDTDSYHTPVFERETEVNRGTPYNRLSTFLTSFFQLITVRDAKRIHNRPIYYDTNEPDFKRLGALRYSNTFQLHLFSVLINLLIFVFIFLTLNDKLTTNTKQ